jgi:hypothetical protein
MRLIDADALDMAFTNLRFNQDMSLAHWGDRKDWCLHGHEVEKLIHDAPTIGGWISVKDRLPDKSGKYLVTVTSNVDCKPFVKTAWFLLKLWDNWQFKYECEPNVPGFYNGDGEGDWVERMVTHWMPLPEPPKEAT